MRRKRREMGRFLMSVGFAAGFIIRDLMEDSSPVRGAAKDAWQSVVNFLTPADSNNGSKKQFPEDNDDSDKDDAGNDDAGNDDAGNDNEDCE